MNELDNEKKSMIKMEQEKFFYQMHDIARAIKVLGNELARSVNEFNERIAHIAKATKEDKK